MAKRWIHPSGSEGFPETPEAEAGLRQAGFVPEGEAENKDEEEKPKKGKAK